MKDGTRESYQTRMMRVLLYVQNHLDDPLPLEELAGIASFSPYHFHRIFRGMVGESVKEHVRRLRLERAAQRLRTTEQPIVRVALDAGYETNESFTRAFDAMFGEAPSAYRKMRGRALGKEETDYGTYAQLCGEWLPASGRELAGAPSLEFYLNDPATTRPEDLVTEICLPLED